MISLYKQLFSPVSTNDEEKDLEIQSKIRYTYNSNITVKILNETRRILFIAASKHLAGYLILKCFSPGIGSINI